MKIYIASSRPIGDQCREWAKLNYPGFDFVNSIAEADVVISVLYRDLIKPAELAKVRAYNFHVGLLPEYRGSACHNWAIINGEQFTGVTLHEIDEGIDTGPIIDAFPFPIGSQDTAETVLKNAEDLIYKMFQSWFTRLCGNEYITMPQDPKAGHTYSRKDLQLAKNLTRLIRAFTFEDKEPAFYFNSKGQKVYIEYE